MVVDAKLKVGKYMINLSYIIDEINQWLDKEKKLGSPNPNNIVLATAGKEGIPHSRIVAIREMNEQGILFFTQRGTRKVAQLTENPRASMTLWLPLQQREVIIDGFITALNQKENEHYWNLLPYDRKLRFSAYSPTSSQPIQSLSELEEECKALSLQYNEVTLPISSYYCGFRLIPEVFYFYTLGTTTFSEIIKYSLKKDVWQKQILSP